MFKLHLKKDGEIKTALLSPKNSSLLWEEDLLPVLGNMSFSSTDLEVERVSKSSPNTKSRITKKLKIQLGFACNYSCSYCSQGGIRRDEQYKLDKFKQDDLTEFFLKLNSELEIHDSEDVQIEFWGGETLLYWEEVKYLTVKLRESYKKIKLMLFTNGSLIKAEMADFCLENELQFIFSHDGPNFKSFRGRDPLAEEKTLVEIKPFFEKMNQSNLISFNAAINPKNLSLLSVRKYISEKLGVDESLVIVNYDLVIPYNESGLEFLKEGDSNLIREIYKEYLTMYPFNLKLGKLDLRLNEFYKAMSSGKNINSYFQKCGMDSPESLAINLKGEILTCQNVTVESGHKIGTLDNFSDVKLNTATHFSHREECVRCPVVQICRGSCMFLEGELWKRACDQHFAWGLSFLKFAIFIQTGFDLISIEGENIRNRSVKVVNF